MKTVAYILANKVCPSGYYRITQYFCDDKEFCTHSLMPIWVYRHWHALPRLLHAMIGPLVFLIVCIRMLFAELSDICGIKRGRIKNIIIQRTISPRWLLWPNSILLRIIASSVDNLIWDFDDNIIGKGQISQKEVKILSKYARHIIVTHEFLKSTIAKEYQHKVLLLPTTDGDMAGLDQDKIVKNRLVAFKNTIRLVWVGTFNGVPYLERIVPALEQCAKQMKQRGKDLELSVVCNRQLSVPCKYLKIRDVEWSHDKAIAEMKNAHIGIMPLVKDSYTLGKGGFKLIQYYSISLPVIGSNVGFNSEIIQSSSGILIDDEQSVALWNICDNQMLYDPVTYQEMSRNAYRLYSENFNYFDNLAKIKEILKKSSFDDNTSDNNKIRIRWGTERCQ